MLKRREDLVSSVLGQTKQADEAKTRLEKLIKKLYKDTNSRLLALLRNPKLVSGDKRISLAVATRIMKELDKVVTEAGMDAVINGYLDEFEGLSEQVEKYFKKLGVAPQLANSSQEALKAYVRFSETQLRNLADRKLKEPLQEALFQGVFSDANRSDLVNNLETVADNLSTAQLEVLVDETFNRYQRALTVETAEDVGLEIYEYVGPNDEITSDQCREILENAPHGVSGMYYKDEIGVDMADGLEEDPLIAGGHINCRHKFMPLTLDYAKSQGFEP